MIDFSATQSFLGQGRTAAGASLLDLRTPNHAALQYVQAIQSALMAWPRVYDSADRASINSPMFWWQLRSDAMFAGAIKNRRQKVAGLDFWMKPADSSEGARIVADRIDWLCHKIPRFAAGRYELGQAIFRGSAFAAITGKRVKVQAPGTRKPLPWWVPGPLVDVDRWRWALQRDLEADPDADTADRMSQPLRWHMYSYARRDWEPVRNTNHFVMWFYEQPESALGYGAGLNNSLYAYLKAKEVALNLGLRGMRRWAMGILKAAVETLQRPGDERQNTDTESIATQYRDALRSLLAEDVLVHDAADAVEVITGGMEGHQIVVGLLEYLDRGVLSLVQAGDLTTSQGQQGVERGNAETQKDSEQEAFAWDIHLLEEALTDSLIKQVYHANRRLLERECAEAGCPLGECPSIKLGQADSSQGPLQELQVIKAAQEAGFDKIPEGWAYERAGIPMAGPDDAVLKAPQQGGMDMFGGMGVDPMAQAEEAGLEPVGGAPDELA